MLENKRTFLLGIKTEAVLLISYYLYCTEIIHSILLVRYVEHHLWNVGLFSRCRSFLLLSEKYPSRPMPTTLSRSKFCAKIFWAKIKKRPKFYRPFIVLKYLHNLFYCSLLILFELFLMLMQTNYNCTELRS